jgi:hypothetical protein
LADHRPPITRSQSRPVYIDQQPVSQTSSATSGFVSDDSQPTAAAKRAATGALSDVAKRQTNLAALRRFSVADIQNAWIVDDEVMNVGTV